MLLLRLEVRSIQRWWAVLSGAISHAADVEKGSRRSGIRNEQSSVEDGERALEPCVRDTGLVQDFGPIRRGVIL